MGYLHLPYVGDVVQCLELAKEFAVGPRELGALANRHAQPCAQLEKRSWMHAMTKG